MKKTGVALAAGLLFGFGLTISQMVNPAKVLAFLDLTESWDPSLIFVMGGALGVTALGYTLILKRPHPVFAERFQLPDAKHIDMRLIYGAALFGIGWGLSGYCPGPAVSALAIGSVKSWIFFVFLILGMYGKQSFDTIVTKREKAR